MIVELRHGFSDREDASKPVGVLNRFRLAADVNVRDVSVQVERVRAIEPVAEKFGEVIEVRYAFDGIPDGGGEDDVSFAVHADAISNPFALGGG